MSKKKKKRNIGKVFIHNNLVEAHYTNLGSLEAKLLVVVAFFFQQQQAQQLIQTNFVSFDLDELADYLRIERNNFPYLRERIRNIQSAFISYENEHEQWEQDIPLFEPPKYHYFKEGEKKQFHRVDFQIHEKLTPYFMDLGKKSEPLLKTRTFTQIEGSTPLDFSSKRPNDPSTDSCFNLPPAAKSILPSPSFSKLGILNSPILSTICPNVSHPTSP